MKCKSCGKEWTTDGDYVTVIEDRVDGNRLTTIICKYCNGKEITLAPIPQE